MFNLRKRNAVLESASNLLLMKNENLFTKKIIALFSVLGLLTCMSCKCDLSEESEDESRKQNTAARNVENDSVHLRINK